MTLQDILEQRKKTCPNCNGKGFVIVTEIDGNTHAPSTCVKCQGKGTVNS